MKTSIHVASAAALLSLLGLSMPQFAYADINIGVVLSLTGPAASLGLPENDTIKLWPAQIGDQKVNVIILNDNSDPTTATTSARKLVTESKVDVLIGSSVTPPSLAIVEVAGETQTPLLSLAGGGAIVNPVDGPRRWSFKFSPPEAISTAMALDHMKRNGAKTLAFIGFANAYGDGFARIIEPMAAERGLKLVASERYLATDTSVVGQVVKVLSAKPDAIFIAAAGTPGALPQIELAERGFTGPVYQTQGIANNEFLRIGGKALEGTFVTVAPVLVAEQLADSNPIRRPAIEYVTRFETKYGVGSRSLFGATAWDVFYILQHAAETALKTTKPGTPEFRTALRDQIERLKEFVAAEGVYNMSDKDHNGVDTRCQVLVRIEGGKWKLVQ